jgi:hypothetical protein
MRFIVACVLWSLAPSVALACGMSFQYAKVEVRLADAIEAIDEAPEVVEPEAAAPEVVAPVVATPAPEPPPAEPEQPPAGVPEDGRG